VSIPDLAATNDDYLGVALTKSSHEDEKTKSRGSKNFIVRWKRCSLGVGSCEEEIGEEVWAWIAIARDLQRFML